MRVVLQTVDRLGAGRKSNGPEPEPEAVRAAAAAKSLQSRCLLPSPLAQAGVPLVMTGNVLTGAQFARLR